MPAWIHDRAEHILAKNPSMPKGQAFAIATQQSHSLGKSPRGYGTAAGRHEAKTKYDTPKDDKRTANPGGLKSEKMAEVLHGGLADGKKPSDFSSGQLRKGIRVEREHTTDKQVAQEIAMDHLSEIPDYYDRLEKIEKNAAILSYLEKMAATPWRGALIGGVLGAGGGGLIAYNANENPTAAEVALGAGAGALIGAPLGALGEVGVRILMDRRAARRPTVVTPSGWSPTKQTSFIDDLPPVEGKGSVMGYVKKWNATHGVHEGPSSGPRKLLPAHGGK